MKNFSCFITASILIAAASVMAYPQTAGDYRSTTTGNWNSTATWEKFDGSSWVAAVSTPTSADGVIMIRNPHLVTVTAAVSVDQVVFDAGAQVNINTAIALTVADGAGIDLTINGILINNGTLTRGGSATFTIGSTGKYVHNTASSANGSAWTSLNANSDFEYQQIGAFSAVPNYGNLIVNTGGNATLASSTLTVNGNLTIQSGVNYRIVNTAATSATLNLAGNLILNGSGTFTGNVGGTGLATMNLGGSINSGAFAAGVGSGGFILNFTGGVSAVTFAPSSPYSSDGNISVANIPSGKTVTIGTALTLNGGHTLSVNGALNCGSNIVSGGGTFTLSAGGTLGIGSVDGITSTGATGNIQTTTRNFSISGNYVYNGNVPQVTGNGLPASVNDLTINNNTNVSLSSGVTVNGTLNLAGGDLDTGSFTLTMPGTAVSTGTRDVIGNVIRTGFVTNIPLSFGNPFNTITITSGITPANILVNLVKDPPGDFASAVRRTLTITPDSGGFTATLQLHYNDSELNGNTESSLVLWRNSPGTWTNQGGTVTDDTVGDNNYVQLSGVTQFSPWTIAGPSAPTAVRLKCFNAASFADGAALTWETGYEVDNLGFHVYREQKGKRTRVTPSIIAGSALTVGPRGRLRAGYSYSWFDPQGTPNTTYYLESVDLSGEHGLVGPIYPQNSGTLASPKRPHAMLLRDVAAATATDQASTGWATALPRAARSATLNSNVQTIQVQQAIAAGKAVKIAVNHSGWYRVTQPELAEAGLSPNTDARLLQLYVDGDEAPIRISGNGLNLSANDAVEFYGVGLDTSTTDTRTYWLVSGQAAGKRISSPKRMRAAKGDDPLWAEANERNRNFAYTTERRDKLVYFPNLLNGDDENIFGNLVMSEPLNQSLTVKNFDRDSVGQPQLEVVLQGATLTPHTVQVQLNGIVVGTIRFDDRKHQLQKFTLDKALVGEGENILTLTSNGSGTEDVSFVDSLRLTYARLYRAENNTLQFSVPPGQTVRISGFTTANIQVLDITKPDAVTELSTIAGPMGTGYAVKVQGRGNETHTYLAFADQVAERAAGVAANQPSSWNNSANGADMVILTHKDFRQSIEPLAALRRSQGLSVAVVDVEDVYDEFTYGAHTPLAVKDFLSRAANHWMRKPRYLLLVGDSSWDPRDYTRQGDSDFVPTKLLDTAYMETASDDWLADFNGDDITDLAVGRLPARTATEAALMVRKIIAFEQERQLDAPLRGALLVADRGFETQNTQTKALLPLGMTVERIERGVLNNDADASSKIVMAIDQGPLLVNYYGHGSVRVWTGAGLLDSDLANGLTNTNHLSLFVLMTCLNGYAHDAYTDSLGEALMKAQNGGAVAVWASSGFTEPQPQFTMNAEFYRQLFGATPVTLGEAIRNAKQVTTDLDVRRTWILLGDPAMRIR